MDQLMTASYSRLASFRKLKPSTIVGIVIVGVIVLCAVLAPWIAPYDPTEADFMNLRQPPSFEHWMGTDSAGRDIFSRVLFGVRLDIGVMLLVTLLPLPVGVLLGAIAGYYGGWVDAVISRVADTLIAFPFLILVMAVVAIVGPGLNGVMIGIPLAGWALYARMARAEMLVVREQNYMLATKTLGYTDARSIFRHAVPTIMRTSLSYSTVDMIVNLLLISGLSYLGLGQQPPDPELGAVIADGQAYLLNAWWIATFPGLTLVALGVGIGLIGDGLSDRDLLAGG
ncbi:peptide/nickel transport system permease protein [Pararhizobium capsulatum DSM 1112]|uniref:Peptide/nickel transport system permease protein n=1 Tax=Pararhizobium capsulatum DSM 1112 TaxID=1121113 RepID=A0ABU0BYU9_9HYPH|nr:ABC transporter permease [Pararhizobium capsulatum]MDQ0323429.1 peptide/nickel transport system permease protein [Pararhizobium capsulatum DSM 1112]